MRGKDEKSAQADAVSYKSTPGSPESRIGQMEGHNRTLQSSSSAHHCAPHRLRISTFRHEAQESGSFWRSSDIFCRWSGEARSTSSLRDETSQAGRGYSAVYGSGVPKPSATACQGQPLGAAFTWSDWNFGGGLRTKSFLVVSPIDHCVQTVSDV